MSATVTSIVVASGDAVVLTPTINDAIQIALAYMNSNQALAAECAAYVAQIQTLLAQTQEAADQTLAALSPQSIVQSFSQAMSSLPVTLPSQSGVLWNDGGVLSIS